MFRRRHSVEGCMKVSPIKKTVYIDSIDSPSPTLNGIRSTLGGPNKIGHMFCSRMSLYRQTWVVRRPCSNYCSAWLLWRQVSHGVAGISWEGGWGVTWLYCIRAHWLVSGVSMTFGHSVKVLCWGSRRSDARSHTPLVVKDSLQSEGFVRLDWPACSPDMNPTEHMRNELQVRILARPVQPKSIQ